MKNSKKTIIISAISALIATQAYANYTVIINTAPKTFKFINETPTWTKIESKFMSWFDATEEDPFYRYECTNWTPEKETVAEGKEFDQTATDCKSKQYAQVIDQEKNDKTGEIRTVGGEYTDKSQEQIVTNQTDTKKEIGTKAGYLTIKNPVQGQSGIYDITDGKGGTFKSYVNMTDDGGNWILVARWTASPAGTITFNNIAVKGNPMTTYSNSSSTYPVIPTGKINDSDRMLIKGGSAGWKSRYGDWASFSTFNPSAVVTASGFPASTSIGPRTLYMRANGWPTVLPQNMTGIFGLWTTYGNTGPCGGANIAGSSPVCLTYSGDTGTHFDISSLKELYIKSNN